MAAGSQNPNDSILWAHYIRTDGSRFGENGNLSSTHAPNKRSHVLRRSSLLHCTILEKEGCYEINGCSFHFPSSYRGGRTKAVDDRLVWPETSW